MTTDLKLGKKYLLIRKQANKGPRSTWPVVQIEVRLMAVSGIHAMVRRPGCAPFVCGTDELSPL